MPGLQAQQHVHVDAEGFFDSKRHLGGEGGVAVDEVGEGGAPHAQDFGGTAMPCKMRPQLWRPRFASTAPTATTPKDRRGPRGGLPPRAAFSRMADGETRDETPRVIVPPAVAQRAGG